MGVRSRFGALLFRRSGSVKRRQQLRFESLESRQLLAGDATPHSGVQVTETEVLTHHDSIPRFAANPTVTAVQDGVWSDSATWSDGNIPGEDAVVQIPAGVSVLYDLDSQVNLDAVEVAGQLSFHSSVDTSIWLNELMVLPSGSLMVGTSAVPIAANVTAEIVFTDTPGVTGTHFKTGSLQNPGIDPSQFGNGLLVFGKLELNGAAKTPFARATEDIDQGDDSINLDVAVQGWQSGDLVVIPQTSQSVISFDGDEPRETETLRIAEVQDGQISLQSAAVHDHLGISENDFDIQRYAHVANISRNVILRSENPSGVRGHFSAFAGADIAISHAEFRSLGRTSADAPVDNTLYNDDGSLFQIGSNQIARYPVHLHHMNQPFEISGAVVNDGLKWGIAVHDSDDGLIQDNVVFDVDGAGIVTESATETGNAFLNNLIIKVDGGHLTDDGRGGSRRLQDGLGEQFVEIAADGSGFWLRASAGTFVGNTVYDAAGYGFNFNGYYNTPARNPDFAFLQLDEFSANETAASKGGLWFTWSQGGRSLDQYARQTVSDFLAWHVSHEGVKTFHEANLSFENITVIADPDVSNANVGNAHRFDARATIGMDFGADAYINDNFQLTNIRVQGANIGIVAPGMPDALAATLDGAVLGNYINIAYPEFAKLSALRYTRVTVLPSRVGRSQVSMPDVVSDVWHENLGTLFAGRLDSDGPPAVSSNGLLGYQLEDQLIFYGFETDDSVRVIEADDVLLLRANRELFTVDRTGISEIVFLGNDGNDTIVNQSSLTLIASGGNGNDWLEGGSGGDRLVGGAGHDVLFGRAGNDVLEGESGDDLLIGGEGIDVLYGGEGIDSLYGVEIDDWLYDLGAEDIVVVGDGANLARD